MTASNDEHMTFGEDPNHFEAADGYRLRIAPDRVWAIYHLLAGGYEDKAAIEAIVGLPPGRLASVNMNHLFLACDNSWRYVSHRGTGLALKVRCANCMKRTHYVPCSCGAPAAFLANEPVATGYLPSSIDASYLTQAARAIADAERRYYGGEVEP